MDIINYVTTEVKVTTINVSTYFKPQTYDKINPNKVMSVGVIPPVTPSAVSHLPAICDAFQITKPDTITKNPLLTSCATDIALWSSVRQLRHTLHQKQIQGKTSDFHYKQTRSATKKKIIDGI